jgi:hypothetical protein
MHTEYRRTCTDDESIYMSALAKTYVTKLQFFLLDASFFVCLYWTRLTAAAESVVTGSVPTPFLCVYMLCP